MTALYDEKQKTTHKLVCLLCRKELETNTTQHACSSREMKNVEILINSKQSSKKTA